MSVAEMVASWWAWLAPATLQASAWLAVAWLAERLLRRRVWPQLLSTLWLVALARLVLPPGLTSPWGAMEASSASAAALASAPLGGPWVHVLASAWLGGALVFAWLRCVRRGQLARRIRVIDARALGAWNATVRGAADALQLRTRFRVGRLDGLTAPAVTGAWRPILLLPQACLEREPTLRDRHALLHELMHVARRDLWLDELCQLVRALFWFHPLVWLAARRIHALGEVACDADVARLLGRDAHDYRDTLVLAANQALAADQALAGWAPPCARAFLGQRSQIFTRIEQLERAPGTTRTCARLASSAAALLLAACVLPRTPSTHALRAQAQAVFERARAGHKQSCFVLQAAAAVLSAPSDSPPSNP